MAEREVEPVEPPDHESAPATGAMGLRSRALNAWGSGWRDCQGDKQTRVTAGGVTVNVREEIAELVEFALAETRRTGYVLKQDQTGAFVCRPIGGTTVPSNHSWGLAIDLNWRENPFTTNANAPKTITPAVVAIWKSVGFSWGGDWSGKKDFMHMEFNGSPAEAARRTAALSPSKPTPPPPPPPDRVPPMFQPPHVLQPIVDAEAAPEGGAVLLGADGSIYNYGGAYWFKGANGEPWFAGRKAARLDHVGGPKPWRITATSGETYHLST